MILLAFEVLIDCAVLVGGLWPSIGPPDSSAESKRGMADAALLILLASHKQGSSLSGAATVRSATQCGCRLRVCLGWGWPAASPQPWQPGGMFSTWK